MNVATIKYSDIANGVGVRTSLFVSGCRLHCKGCFNAEAWDFAYGEPFTKETENEILASLQAPWVQGLTILGGDPMEPENQRELVTLAEHMKALLPNKDLWVFTGYILEHDLMPADGSRHVEGVTERFLNCIDVLVDGPFVQDKYDITLRFRGSSNQRLIDMNKTRAALSKDVDAGIALWEDEPVFSTHSMKND